MTRVWTDDERMTLEVLTPNHAVFNLMLDNIDGYPKTPDDHQFASILVPKEDAEAFIAKLAQAMGVRALVYPPRRASDTAVEVHDNTTEDWYEPGENKYTVSGDIGDILTEDDVLVLEDKWFPLGISSASSWSVNYKVQDLITHGYAGGFVDKSPTSPWSFDSEGSCFFAYTNDREQADTLATWINTKGFLK